ncbi:hypothetical protein B0A48_18014 [Cryoendolithus antarcticus]|uniref:RRM domain-containing protein n=1 Tax=Cryoendolithus antarcticus TaxID=1507870 RepID=A0A1V8SAE0_9PEZI|nr:hypothetical protein B0A48_18014 [Cryoendolithus antarcticus]
MASIQQSVEDLLEEAEKRAQTVKADQQKQSSDSAEFTANADFVSLGDTADKDGHRTRNRGPRDVSDRSKRYSTGEDKHKSNRASRDRSEGATSDRGSANGSVRSRRRSRSPVRDRRDPANKRYRSRERGGDYYRRGSPPPDDDRYYRPSPGSRDRPPRDDRRSDRRDDRRDTGDDRRGHGRDEPRRDNRERRRTPPEPTDDERDRRTVFVQQLAARLRTKELIQFFEQVGPVKEAQIVKDRVSNRSKGVGYVEFRQEESVEKAIGLTGQKLLGIPIIAQLTEAEKNRQARTTEGVATLSNGIPFHRLYVGNIHFSITEDDLRNVFEPFGALEFCQLQKDDGGRSKGYGFVQFTDPTEAKEALEKMNGFELAGRPIRVGLGNDKFTPESTHSLLQRFGSQAQQDQKQAQGSSFSGMGGRGAHAGGTGNFDRAGGKDAEKSGGASALDDADVTGVNFSNYSRDALMRKLARTEEPETAKITPTMQTKKAVMDEPAPSRCVLLKHLYDVNATNEPGWQKELELDVKEECEEKYGHVVHIAIPPGSTDGEIYVKFDRVQGGENAIKGLQGRLFAGNHITAQYVVDAVYNMNFPKASSL